MMREPAEIFVDQRREFGETGLISLAPIAQELPNLLWRGRKHIRASSPTDVDLAIPPRGPRGYRNAVVIPSSGKFHENFSPGMIRLPGVSCLWS